MYQSGRALDEVKKRKSPAKSGRVGITVRDLQPFEDEDDYMAEIQLTKCFRVFSRTKKTSESFIASFLFIRNLSTIIFIEGG